MIKKTKRKRVIFYTEEFKSKVENNEFLEWEEVYAGTHYGTLRTAVETIWNRGKCRPL